MTEDEVVHVGGAADSGHVMLLIASAKSRTLRTLPWGTPSSWGKVSERVAPTRTRKERSARRFWMRMGRSHLKPKEWRRTLLEIKENTQDKLTFSEGCRDIMLQTEKRVSCGTKPTKAELKGRKSTEGFENHDEAVSDDPLQNLADAAKQRDGYCI